MACKKSELVQAINTFATARASGDPNLLNFASNLLSQYVETLEFAEEETEAVEPEVVAAE